MKHASAILMALIFAFLLLIGAGVSQVLTPAIVEWFPAVLPYSNIVKLVPMAVGLSLAVWLIRRMCIPSKGKKRPKWSLDV